MLGHHISVQRLLISLHSVRACADEEIQRGPGRPARMQSTEDEPCQVIFNERTEKHNFSVLIGLRNGMFNYIPESINHI